MADKIPSAEKMLAFLADASPDHIRDIAAADWDFDESQFSGNFCRDRREYAARFLCAASDRKAQWWNARFSDDEVRQWLWSLDSVDRAWNRMWKSRQRRLPPPTKQEPLDFWREVIDARLSRWASRVIAEGRGIHIDMPLGRFWLERRAKDVFYGWRWLHGVQGFRTYTA